MLYKLVAVVFTTGLVSSASAALNFYCPTVNATGFYPACCLGITGQVGVDCVTPHIIGGLPNFECNIGPPYNNRGCCQSIAKPVHRRHSLPLVDCSRGYWLHMNRKKEHARQDLSVFRLDQNLRGIESA
ncbi:hypothetical protein PspLS_09428, partial [Pyricularia sp. CBS 133598]